MAMYKPRPAEYLVSQGSMCNAMQVIAAIISAAVPVDGGRGWTSFGLLLFELNLIVWAGDPAAFGACVGGLLHECMHTAARLLI
jgi:hypothetical protein